MSGRKKKVSPNVGAARPPPPTTPDPPPAPPPTTTSPPEPPPPEIEKFLTAVGPPGMDTETCKTFIFRKEGHTLGNALRSIITNYPDVSFCGYSMPHPAEDVMHFRIQSVGVPAVDVLNRGFEDLVKVCDEVERQFLEVMSDVEIPPDVIDPAAAPSPTSTTTFLKPKPTP